MAVIPVAKALYLCEEVDVEGGLTNLYGLLHRFRVTSFPHTRAAIVVFAQLAGGLGDVTVYVDLRRASDGQLIRPTAPRVFRFADRGQVVQLAAHVEQVVFDEPGVYLAELYCDNTWVADVSFEVMENEGTP